jgi:hypothetical protein
MLKRKKKHYETQRVAKITDMIRNCSPAVHKLLRARRPRATTPIAATTWRDYLQRQFCRPPAPPRPAKPTPGSAATGLDGIPPEFLKHAHVTRCNAGKDYQHHFLGAAIAQLCHHMISSDTAIPEDWKRARVNAPYKRRPVSDPNSYRMLAINPTLYRLYANMLRDLMTEWCQRPSASTLRSWTTPRPTTRDVKFGTLRTKVRVLYGKRPDFISSAY